MQQGPYLFGSAGYLLINKNRRNKTKFACFLEPPESARIGHEFSVKVTADHGSIKI